MIALRILIMGIIGALIGWLTNKIAILSLFRPTKSVKIPLIGQWQGILPKRKEVIATEIGKLVEKELINVDDLINSESSNTSQSSNSLGDVFKSKFSIFDSLKLRPVIIKSILKDINVSDIVEKKINEMDIMELEVLIKGVMKSELKHIEILGGVVGLVIGLLQGVISLII